MPPRSKWRGHSIVYTDNAWMYCDTKTNVSLDPDRRCGYCGQVNTHDGHDGCLGTLRNVSNACCGHGNVRDCYVQFDDGNRLSGREAIEYIHSHV